MSLVAFPFKEVKYPEFPTAHSSEAPWAQNENPGATTQFMVSKRGLAMKPRNSNLELVTGATEHLLILLVKDRKFLNICKADGEMKHWKVKIIAKEILWA